MRDYLDILLLLYPYDIPTRLLLMLSAVRECMTQDEAIILQDTLGDPFTRKEFFSPDVTPVEWGWVFDGRFDKERIEEAHTHSKIRLGCSQQFSDNIHVICIICGQHPSKRAYVEHELHRFIFEAID